ncbi:MAG: TetR/AcrR family transcriptional regulator [Deltaproteobacteria bacterium]|nr:TetR/AcrR family transcriptional regulator [Deltaproteobacteria bacterium]
MTTPKKRAAAEAKSPVKPPAKPTAKRPERLYAGRSAAERVDERRDRLIDAGFELFATRGYRKTTIGILCARARVATRDFYAAFPTRDTLLEAVLARVMGETRAAVMEALADAAGDPVRMMESGLAAFVHAYLDDPRRARIVLVETSGVSREMTLRRRAYMHEFASVIETNATMLAERGELLPRDFSLGALALAGSVHELMMESVYAASPPSIDAVLAECRRLFSAAMAWEGAKDRPDSSAARKAR